MGFLERRRKKKEAQRELDQLGLPRLSWWSNHWNNEMTGAERKKMFKSFFGKSSSFASEHDFVTNPEKEAKKEFSELTEIVRVRIIKTIDKMASAVDEHGNPDYQMLGTYCSNMGKALQKTKEVRLRRMDESNNAGMAEYNRKKEKQENFYWKYFRRKPNYIRPEWGSNKPSEDRISDEEFDDLVDEYLTGMRDSDENYEETTPFRFLNNLFLIEFAKRHEERFRFTKDSQTEDKKAGRGKRKIAEEDLKETYYDLLGVPIRATLKEIKEAFKELIIKWHPDKHRKDPKLALRISIALNKAMDTLKDPDKRKKYDETLDLQSV